MKHRAGLDRTQTLLFSTSPHIYSWKTLIHAAKDPEAIKDCIRATNTWPSDKPLAMGCSPHCAGAAARLSSLDENR